LFPFPANGIRPALVLHRAEAEGLVKAIVYRATWVLLVDCVLPVAAWMSGYRGRRARVEAHEQLW
jgi:hypothetical protein